MSAEAPYGEPEKKFCNTLTLRLFFVVSRISYTAQARNLCR